MAKDWSACGSPRQLPSSRRLPLQAYGRPTVRDGGARRVESDLTGRSAETAERLMSQEKATHRAGQGTRPSVPAGGHPFSNAR